MAEAVNSSAPAFTEEYPPQQDTSAKDVLHVDDQFLVDHVHKPQRNIAFADNLLQEPPAAPPFGGPSSAALGVERRTERCWEYGTVVLEAADYEEIRIVSCWFGHAEHADLRTDITRDVGVLLDSAGLAAGGIAAGVPRLETTVEVGASVRKWGDPAQFCLKRLEVTYDLIWLGAEEAAALSLLRRRVTDKALEAPDLEELLNRLSAALLDAHSPSQSGDADDSAPLRRTSPRWKRLGFQSCDPRTDLRTGRLALESLVYLAERYPLAAGQMATESQEDAVDYPFAVASINVTQLLARYLGLVNSATTCSVGCTHAAPRRVVRVFAQLLLREDASGTEAFGELHAAVMTRLHTTWRALKTGDPALTIMDFPRALDATMSLVDAFFLSGSPKEATELRGISQFEMPAFLPQVPPASEASGSLRSVADSFSQTAGYVGDYFRGVFATGPPPNVEIQDGDGLGGLG